MTSKPFFHRGMLILSLIAIPFLVGSQCAFFFSSGSGSDDDEEKERIVASGIFGGVPVAGANYESGSISGVTDSDGGFNYETGQPVRFSIGEIELGRAVSGKDVITAQDLVPEDDIETPAVVNIERLLLSLDAEPEDDIITIPEEVRNGAVRSNQSVASAIDYLDYSDDDAFANAASQLVTVLTRDYPFTGVLVDRETAQEKIKRSLHNR